MKYEVYVTYKRINGSCYCDKEKVKLCECKTIKECNAKIDEVRNDVFRLTDIGYSEIHKVTKNKVEKLHKTIYC